MPAAVRRPQVAMRRAERRVARAVVAAQVSKALPTRIAAGTPSADKASKVCRSAVAQLGAAELRTLNARRASVSRLVPAPYRSSMPRAAGLVSAGVRQRESKATLEYTWSARKEIDGLPQIVMLKVQADAEGNVLRSRLLHSS